MVLKSFDDEMRAHNFEAQAEDWWKAQGKCLRGDACSFRQDFRKPGASASLPLPSPNRGRKTMGKFFEKQAAQKKQSIQENGPDAVQRILWRNLHQSIAFLTKHP